MPVRPPLTRYRRKENTKQRGKRPNSRPDMRQVRRLLSPLHSSFAAPVRCLNIISSGGRRRSLNRFACQRNVAAANRPAVGGPSGTRSPLSQNKIILRKYRCAHIFQLIDHPVGATQPSTANLITVPTLMRPKSAWKIPRAEPSRRRQAGWRRCRRCSAQPFRSAPARREAPQGKPCC
jgi:hypothetical protein